MSQEYEYLKKIPRGDNYFSVPISGLFTELSGRHKLFLSVHASNPETRLLIEKKHMDASDRIGTCIFYLVTISHRLLDNSNNSLLINKRLDWECIRIYSQIILDSFAVFVPLFYGISGKYEIECFNCKKPGHKNTVDSFNNLTDWFSNYSLNDELAQSYKFIRKQKSSWYNLLNADRAEFIHRRTTPKIFLRKTAQELGWSDKVKKDEIIKINEKTKKMEVSILEQEIQKVLKNLFDFLAFSNGFFVEKLKERNIIVLENDQYKYGLDGDFKDFNKLVFGEENPS